MEYLQGPDQIIPTENIFCCDPEEYIKIRSTNNEFDKQTKPQSIPSLLHDIATKYPNEFALVTTKGRGGAFKTYTYEDYEMNVRFTAKGFLKLGLKRHYSVCILGFNSPEWHFSELGAIYAGGIATGIYVTNSPESCLHAALTSRANIIVLEDDIQLQKILSIRDRLPDLKAIIQYSGEPKHPDVLSWADFIQLGSEQPDDELEKVMKTIAINECCILIFTSGTVGKPKGVMINHDNIVFNAKSIIKRLQLGNANETFVSYLPLSHIAAQIVDIFVVITCAGVLYFADRNALKGTLVKTLQLARPTRFLGVPRVWEKIRENMLQIGAENGYIKKQIAIWAKERGLEHNMNKLKGIPDNSWGYFLANRFVFKKIKSTLGFDRCSTFACAAAPLSSDVKKYFFSLDMPITEAFGMSEVVGHTLGSMDSLDLDSVGVILDGFDTKICQTEVEEYGEICFAGRHVFMGYINEPEKTREAIDDEGWMHSGDIGKLDDKNKIYITGRLKELLITAGGENIAPVPIEQIVKQEMPFISYAILIGDKRKFLSLLITLKTEIDDNTQIPKDNLTKDVQILLKGLGSEATTVTEVLEEGPHPKFKAVIEKALEKVNSYAISNAQRIQKYKILSKDLSIATGEIGPTMKIKRYFITEKYKDIIESLYS